MGPGRVIFLSTYISTLSWGERGQLNIYFPVYLSHVWTVCWGGHLDKQLCKFIKKTPTEANGCLGQRRIRSPYHLDRTLVSTQNMLFWKNKIFSCKKNTFSVEQQFFFCACATLLLRGNDEAPSEGGGLQACPTSDHPTNLVPRKPRL